MAGFPLPNPTQDPDPMTGVRGIQGLMQAFSNFKPLAPQGEQPLPASAQTDDAMQLAEQVARAHAESASGGDPRKFEQIYRQLLQQYATQGARVGSSLAEAGVAGLQGAQAAKGLYSLGQAGVNAGAKLMARPGVQEFLKDTRGSMDPEKLKEFYKTISELPKEWQDKLQKELAFKMLKGKDPFAGKPVPLGPPSGSAQASAAANRDWPTLLAKSRSAGAAPTPPAPAAVPAAVPTPATPPVSSGAEAVRKALESPAARAAAAKTQVYFDTAARVTPKESSAIFSGIRQAIPKLYDRPEKVEQLMSRLANVERYMNDLGPTATKADLLQELRKQGMLTKSAYEVLRKMGYTGLRSAAGPKSFDEIMNPAFSAADKLK